MFLGNKDVPDRCEGVEFDAIILDEAGVTLFFKGESVYCTLCFVIPSLDQTMLRLVDCPGEKRLFPP